MAGGSGKKGVNPTRIKKKLENLRFKRKGFGYSKSQAPVTMDVLRLGWEREVVVGKGGWWAMCGERREGLLSVCDNKG